MQIDKIIKREVISLVVSVVLILLIFIGVSFASFFSVAEGQSNTISFGDVDLTFCNDVECNENYTNFGHTIGLTDVGGVSTPLAIFPYESDTEALETTPYIFNVANTGSLKLYLNIYLEEDEDFVPPATYSTFTQTTELYSNYIKVGIGECSDGIPDFNTVEIYRFGNLIDNKVISGDELNVGENRTYCLWTWLAEDTPNAVQATYFVANLSVSGEYLPYVPTLRNEILKNNTAYADNVNSTFVSNATPGIDYGKISSSTNGKGLYYTTNTSLTTNGKKVYFFRGAVDNNYVVFNDMCFRIIRTNEDGTVKVRYGGLPTLNEGVYTCPQTGTNISISSSSWSAAEGDNAYMGYMLGTVGASSFELTHTNSSNSPVKTIVDNWYRDNVLLYNNFVANEVFCNDRSVGASGTVGGVTFDSTIPFGTNNTIFAVNRRLSSGGDAGTAYNTTSNDLPATPTYKCLNTNDQFTLNTDSGGSSDYGNNKLNYPVGLLTADEMVFAGGEHGVSAGSSMFLNIGTSYWLMSPMRSVSGNSRVYVCKTGGELNVSINTSSLAVVPVISLNNNALVTSGNGVYNDPYIIDLTAE